VLVSFRLEIMLILMQDRCTICGKCTIGSEIILDAPDVEIVLVSVQGRCIVCAQCTIGLEIVLDSPNDTPR
jgi:hypothetical protein